MPLIFDGSAQTITNLNVPASQVSGTLSAAQIGTLTASQIASVNASALAGTLTASQIASVNASALSGLITPSQLNAKPVVAAYFSNDNGHNYATSQTGFTWLDTTFTPKVQGNYFLVIATVNGAGDDDSAAVLQRYTSGSWQEPDSLRGSTADSAGFQGSFGDFSVVRSSVMENKQTVQYTAVFLDQPNTSGTVGYRVRCSCENSSGFWSNRPMGTDGLYNTNTSRSTLLVLEITA